MIERQGFFKGAQADTSKGKAMSPGTSASGGTRSGNDRDDNKTIYVKKPKKNIVEDKPPKKKINQKQKKLLNYLGKETKKVPAAVLKKKLGEIVIGGTATGFMPYMIGSGIYGLGKKIFNKEPIIKMDKSSSIKDYNFKDIENQLAFEPGSKKDKQLKSLFKEKELTKDLGIPFPPKKEKKLQELLKEDQEQTEFPKTELLRAADGGAIRKNFSIVSNGILDLDETEGEKISLTAEAPQFTEEEKLI